jgi:hypothetical protein
VKVAGGARAATTEEAAIGLEAGAAAAVRRRRPRGGRTARRASCRQPTPSRGHARTTSRGHARVTRFSFGKSMTKEEIIFTVFIRVIPR